MPTAIPAPEPLPIAALLEPFGYAKITWPSAFGMFGVDMRLVSSGSLQSPSDVRAWVYGRAAEALACVEARGYRVRESTVTIRADRRNTMRLEVEHGGDLCPRCGLMLDYDETGDDREPEIQHPEPQCGWLPDGYPSSREGSGEPPTAGPPASSRSRAAPPGPR